MRCPVCRSTAVRERSERTAQGYRRFRCGDFCKQFNERSAGLLNRAQEAVREWEAELTPALTEDLRRRRKGKVGRSWYVDETYIRVRGRWRYLYRAIDRDGALVDVLLSEHRDLAAASAFFCSAKRSPA